MPPPLSLWPWHNLPNFKYLFYVPFLWRVLYPWIYEKTQIENSWCLHILILCALRGLVFQLWYSFGSMLFLTRNRRILQQGVDFKQIDREWDWDNFIILQAMIASVACFIYSSFTNISLIPRWNPNGAITVLLLHILVSEPLYYYLHKRFHTSSYLFSNYHSLHHASVVLQSFTAGSGTPLEHVGLTAVMSLPIVGAFFMGNGSCGIIYGYVLLFDFMRCLGHSNVEIISDRIFQAIPLLKYLIYTPTYHSLHHTEMDTNFCLFMPIYDVLGNTLNSKSWDLHKKITSNLERQSRVPDFVFLSHIVDVTAAMHIPCLFRSYSAEPFRTRLFLLPIWPPVAIVVLIISVFSKPFLNTFYNLRGRHYQTWAVPKCGFQYFLPFARKGINDRIEQAILRADRLGIKVIQLAALNKNEALNSGGALFVNKHPDLKVRVVHGNTLTAAVILKEIPHEVAEVFLSAATSKLGRAIALYLCRKKVRVLMLTSSAERFQSIQKEAPVEFQSYLVRVTNFKAAQNCKTWVVGKWITPREQNWAPPGTHFQQFVVPSILPFRRDCTYSEPAGMKLPDDVEGLGCCEYSMGRGIVHACHAGGVVHMLEGWTHHEVGGIDVDNIDRAWTAALKHGFKPVSTLPKHKSQ